MGTAKVTGALTAALAAALALSTAAVGSTAATPSARRLPNTPCHVFAGDNYWHADISGLPVSRRSAQWLRHMSPSSRLHPDFGPSYGAQPVPYGIPVTIVAASHPLVRVQFTYRSESDHLRYPLGTDTRIEGGKRSSGDRHAIVVDKSTCRLYETWNTRKTSSGWHAGSGATWLLTSNRLRPDGWTSADAAGLPILPGLLRFDEVKGGYVDHAIRFTTDVTDQRHIWPARHDAGSVRNHAYPPMGARFRLKASFSLKGYRADTKVVLRAMKTYGLVLADNGSPWYFQGRASGKWPSGLLDELKTIPASAFQAVNTASLKVSAGSMATH